MSIKYVENLSEEGYYSASNGNVTMEPVFEYNQTVPHNWNGLHCGLDSTEDLFNETYHSPISSIFESKLLHPGKGILFDRIKEAQNTIEDLSSKLCYCENEIIILKQRKEVFETGYYKIQKENELILSDKIIKEELLQKVNNMGKEVSELLKTHQNLVNKHNEQEQKIAVLTLQKNFVEEENTNLKDLNNELSSESEKEREALEKLRTMENETWNRYLILKIEKDALASEYDHILKMFNREEGKCGELENKNEVSVKKLSESNIKTVQNEREILVLEQRNEFLKTELKNITEIKLSLEKNMMSEKKSLQKDNEVVINNNDLLKEELILQKEMCNKSEGELRESKQKNGLLKKQLDGLQIQYHELLSVNNISDQKVCEFNEINVKIKREKKLLIKKLSMSESERESNVLLLKKIKQHSIDRITDFEVQIDNLQKQSVLMKEEYVSEKQNIVNTHQIKLIELESVAHKLQENNAKLHIELDNIKQHYTGVKQKLKLVQNENANQVIAHQKEITNANSLNSKLSEQCSVLEPSINEYKTQAAEYCELFNDMKVKYSELLNDKDEKSKHVQSLEETIQFLSSENRDLTKTNKENLELINLLNKQSKEELLSERNMKDVKISSLELYIEELAKKLKDMNCQSENMKKENDDNLSLLISQHKSTLRDCSEEKQILEKQCQILQRDLLENNKQIDQLSAKNNEQKNCMFQLANDFEECKMNAARCATWKKENETKKDVIDELSSKISMLTKDNKRLQSERKDHSIHTNELLERLNKMIQDYEKQRNEIKDEKKKNLAKEEKFKKELYEISSKNERLKVDLRQRTLQKHSACGEIDVIKSNHANVKKELVVLTELNKKLEEVNRSIQEDNEKLRRVNEQLQIDIQTLKCSFEDLLAKELEAQRSEHLVKENELLKKLSTYCK